MTTSMKTICALIAILTVAASLPQYGPPPDLSNISGNQETAINTEFNPGVTGSLSGTVSQGNQFGGPTGGPAGVPAGVPTGGQGIGGLACRTEFVTVWDTEYVESEAQECNNQYVNECKNELRQKCVPTTRQECNLVQQPKCDTIYNKVCNEQLNVVPGESFTETECSTEFKNDCEYRWEGSGNDKVWVAIPGTCKSNPSQVCKNVVKQNQVQVPTTVCNDVPQEVCTTVQNTVCTNVPDQICTTEPTQVCNQVPKRICQDVHKKVPKRVSKKIAKRVCDGQGSSSSSSGNNNVQGVNSGVDFSNNFGVSGGSYPGETNNLQGPEFEFSNQQQNINNFGHESWNNHENWNNERPKRTCGPLGLICFIH